MTAREDILADRLNAEPAIFKGCSSSELGVIVGVATLIWLPVSLLLAGLMGAVTMGFGLAGVGVVNTVVWRDHSVNLSAVAPHVAVKFSARPVSRLYEVWRRLFPHPATPQ